MNSPRTYTVHTAGRTHFYQWMPRIVAHDLDSGAIKTYWPSEASYRRFVRLANSGQHTVTILEEDSIAWQLSRKREHAPDAQDFHDEASDGDWKEYDSQDHEAAAAYYDHIASGFPSDEWPY